MNQWSYYVLWWDTSLQPGRGNLEELHALYCDGWKPIRERVMRSTGFVQYTLIYLEREPKTVYNDGAITSP